MARIRTVKPEFWMSEHLGRLTPLARLTYIGLINIADDDGRGRADVRWLWGQLHAYSTSNTRRAFREALSSLKARDGQGIPFVHFYKVGGVSYYWLPTFCKHQRIDRPSKSRLPAPQDAEEIRQALVDDSALEQGSGIRDQVSGKGARGGPAPEGTATAREEGSGKPKARPRTKKPPRVPDPKCHVCGDDGVILVGTERVKCTDCPGQKEATA